MKTKWRRVLAGTLALSIFVSCCGASAFAVDTDSFEPKQEMDTVIVLPEDAPSAPVDNDQVGGDPVDGTLTVGDPVDGTPVDGTSVDGTSTGDDLVDGDPAGNAPVDGDPGDNTPVDGDSGDDTPKVDAPADGDPVDNDPLYYDGFVGDPFGDNEAAPLPMGGDAVALPMGGFPVTQPAEGAGEKPAEPMGGAVILPELGEQKPVYVDPSEEVPTNPEPTPVFYWPDVEEDELATQSPATLPVLGGANPVNTDPAKSIEVDDIIPGEELPQDNDWRLQEDGKSVTKTEITTDTTTTTTLTPWEDTDTNRKGFIRTDMTVTEETTTDFKEKNTVANSDWLPDYSGYTYTLTETLPDGSVQVKLYTVKNGENSATVKTTTTKNSLNYTQETEHGKVIVRDLTLFRKEGSDSDSSHGNLSNILSGIQIDESLIPPSGSGETYDYETGLFNYNRYKKYNIGNLTFGNNDFIYVEGNLSDGESNQHLGFLISSVYEIKTTTGYGSEPAILFALTDQSGNTYYAYCSDLSTEIDSYSIFTIESLKDSGYFESDDWKHVEAIATNGYWATASGTGSLEEFKKYLFDSGKFSKNELSILNEGMAMSATQAAIWHYANSGDLEFDEDAVFKTTKRGGGGAVSEKELELLQKMYEFLRDEAKTPEGYKSTDVISEDVFKDVSLKITGKDESGSEVVYNTEMSFTLDVQPDRFNAKDTKVTVIVTDSHGNETTTTYILKDENGNDGTGDFDKVDGEKSITYTLKNIKLPDGSTATMNLSGVQNLEKGAYLLTSSEGGYGATQSLVGIFEGERKFNVGVSLRLDDIEYDAPDTPDKPDTPDTPDTPDKPDTPDNPDTPDTPDKPDTPDTPDVPDTPDTPDDEVTVYPEEPETPETPDKVPTAVDAGTPEAPIVPKTGDDTVFWFALCMMSLVGIAALNIRPKKTKH